jgi:hypothetical protein
MNRTSPEEYDDRLSEIESGDDDILPKLEDAQTSPSTTSKPNGVKTPAHLQKRRRCLEHAMSADGKKSNATASSRARIVPFTVMVSDRQLSRFESPAEMSQLQSAHTISPRTEGETPRRNTSKISSTEYTERRLFCTSSFRIST